jgi:hypothetical protein
MNETHNPTPTATTTHYRCTANDLYFLFSRSRQAGLYMARVAF